MRNFKKVIAGALALLMLALSVNVSFAAEEYSEKEAVVVAKVNASKVMTGTDKGFEPSKSLTRAEAAAIVVRMKGISESAVKTAAGTTLFTDVAASHWASGYVNQASNLGIVKGVSATQFAPDREVTIAEFTTMAIRALGAGKLVDSEGVWPTNYVNFANEEGILDDVTAVYTAVATRMNAATIVVNTLESETWAKDQVDTTGKITYKKTGRLMHLDVLNIGAYANLRLVTINAKDGKLETVSVVEDGAAISGDTVEGFDFTGLDHSTEYDLWYDYDEKEIIGIWKSEKSKQDSVEFSEITKNFASNKIKLMVDGAEKEYKFADAFEVYYNGKLQLDAQQDPDTTTLTKDELKFGKVVLNASNKITAIQVEKYEKIGVVDSIEKNSIRFNTSDIAFADEYTAATSLPIKDSYEYIVSKDGSKIELDDIKEDDVVFFYETTNDASVKKYVILVATDTVEGKVKSVSDKTVKIDDTKYDRATTLSIDVDSEVIAYKNPAGKIVALEEVEGAAGDLAVVTSLRVAYDNYNKESYEFVLTSLDGTKTETLKLDKDETKENLVKKLADGSAHTFAIADVYTGDIDYTELEAINTKSIVGSLVRYEISGDKVTLKEIPGYAKKADAEKNIVAISGFTYDDGKMQLAKTVSQVTTTYRLTDNTKVVKVKALSDITKSAAKYSVKADIIDVNDLGDGTYSGWIANIDADTNKIGVLVIDINSAARYTSTKTYGVLTEKSSIKGDDYKSELTFVTAEGEEFVTSTKSVENFTIGSLYDISVKDDVLEDYTEVTDTKATNTFAYTIGADTMRLYDGTVLDLAEKVIFASVDEDGEFEEATSGDIVLVNKATVDATAANRATELAKIDHTKITKIFYATNTDTNIDEVIAIEFVKEVIDGVTN